MKAAVRLYFIFPLLITMLFSCEDGPPGVPGPERITGDAEGRVTLFDEFGEMELSPEGVSVKATGSDHEVTSITGSDGEYLLTEMKTGHYYMEYTKEGFGKAAFSRAFLGGERPEAIEEVKLFQMSTTLVEEIHVSVESGNMIFDGTISPASSDEYPRMVVIYFYRNDSVSNRIYDVMDVVYWRNVDSIQFHHEVSVGYLDLSGGTTYMVAYGLSGLRWVSNYYYDEQHVRIYNVDPAGSKRTSVIIP